MSYAIKSDVGSFLNQYAPHLKDTYDFLYVDPPVPKNRRWEAVKSAFQLSLPTLKSTGVTVVSATDDSVHYLRFLLDDVYGRANFIGMVTVDTGNVHNNARLLSATHEYLLLYAKNKTQLLKSGAKWRTKRDGLEVLRRTERRLRTTHGDDHAAITRELKEWMLTQPLSARLKKFYNADADGLFTSSDLSAPKNGLFYEVVNPNTGNPVRIPSRGWGVSEETMRDLVDSDNIVWGSSDDHQPLKKLYLKDTPDQVLRSVMPFPSRSPERLLKQIIGPGRNFDDVRDVELLQHIIHTLTPPKASILNLYAGSGTVAHAVMELNYKHKQTSQRTFTVVNYDRDRQFTDLLKPRLEALQTGKWFNGQHRPRKADIRYTME